MNIKIIYFANLIPNEWEPIIIEQLESLKKLELYKEAIKIFMSVIGSELELNKLKQLINLNYTKIQLKNIFKENYYEYPGIKTLYQIAEDEDDEIILYFHSKGITSKQHDIRKYLFINTIQNYKLYVDEFKKNKNLEVAGVFPNKDGFCYFNFFWTRSSYVRNYCSRPEISENRYIWEVWIGNEFSRKKSIITFSPLIGYTQLQNSNEIWNIDKIKKRNYIESKNNKQSDLLNKIENTDKIKPIRIYNPSDIIKLSKPQKINNTNYLINKYANKNKIFINLSSEIFELNNYKKILSANNLVQIKKSNEDQTLKEFLFYNSYKNNEQIGFIYYNYNNDDIFEDLLHHAFINKIPILVGLNVNIQKVTSHFNIENQLLLPKKSLQFVKKNITILVIGFNQYTYVKNMVSQIEKYTSDIVIVDNASTYEPLINYYNTEYKYSLLKMDKNYGHKVYENKLLTSIFGELFILTDPDLEFNSKLPNNFISNLVNISNKYKAGRVGFALEISSKNIRSELTYAGMPLKLWESKFWQKRINDPEYELYCAPIDTTFCLINTIHNSKGLSIRVGGNYICKHLPWYINFHEKLLSDEYDNYLVNNISTNFWKDKFKIKQDKFSWIKKRCNNNLIVELGKKILHDSYFKDTYKISTDIKSIKIDINKDTTIKEIMYNLYIKKSSLNISIITCDYEGKEEYFIEDLLYFCYINKLKLLIKLNKNIIPIKNLLNQFNIYFNNELVQLDKLDEQFNLLYLEPNENICLDIYKPNMTTIIIGYNQYTYIKNMVTQLEKYTKDIVIIDNGSTFKPLIDYYNNEYKYTLLKMNKNHGHKVYEKEFINNIIGDIYMLTDPDLEFNKNLPNNFIQEMINISNYYQAEKVGFALLIDAPDIRTDVKSFGKSIIDFEKQYWVCKFYYPNHELYSAAIDTTFCLVNKQNKGGHYRIGGNYTCKHLPWHIGFDKKLLKDEYEYYSKNNISTNYWKNIT